MTDESGPPDLPVEGGTKKPLPRRIADRWNGLSRADKLRVAGAAVGVIGGAIATTFALTRTTDDVNAQGADEGRDLNNLGSLLLGMAAVGLDDAPQQSRQGGPVSGHWRNQCLNPRLHAAGTCEHKMVWVNDYTKGLGDVG
ncbi:hypothetical protein ABZ747_17660 [Kitasatospora cineracea]|uniref:hypothetical protein n=1 Tax=Kitasatospora cineracea TaxID=88074 RepID=UPI0033F0B44D